MKKATMRSKVYKVTKVCKVCGELKRVKSDRSTCQVCERKQQNVQIFQVWMKQKEITAIQLLAKELGLSKREFILSLVRLYETYYKNKDFTTRTKKVLSDLIFNDKGSDDE